MNNWHFISWWSKGWHRQAKRQTLWLNQPRAEGHVCRKSPPAPSGSGPSLGAGGGSLWLPILELSLCWLSRLIYYCLCVSSSRQSDSFVFLVYIFLPTTGCVLSYWWVITNIWYKINFQRNYLWECNICSTTQTCCLIWGNPYLRCNDCSAQS